MDTENWLPPEITHEDEFLMEELEKLRNHVLEKRNEDISEQLYIYENRVLYASIDTEACMEFRKIISGASDDEAISGMKQSHPIGWETIRNYEHIVADGEQRYYEISKRKAKELFLRGWLEVGLWDRGLGKEQKTYPTPERPEDIGLSSDKKGQFVYGEFAGFSMDMMQNYWRKYLSLPPCERSQKPRFVNQRQSATRDEISWQIFVTPELRNFYYSKDKRITETCSEEFHPLQKEMRQITCRKDTETRHAVIANYDSWQTFLWAMDKEKGNTMNPGNGTLGVIQKFHEDAARDLSVISAEHRRIIRKIASGTGVSGLYQYERDEIHRASESSPKIRLMLRMAQHEAIRSKIGRHFSARIQGGREMASGSREMLVRLKKWISPCFDLIPATAAGGPDQKHFRMEYGEIRLSYYLKSLYGNRPACIWLSWQANIDTPCEIWARFISPETKKVLSEVCLGTRLEGEKAFTSETLGFDLLNERCTISIVLTKTE